MSQDLPPTQLYLPQPRNDMVPRSQVVELFEQGRRRKLTLVSAFAGLGKTTLLSSWLRDVQVHTAWFSLDLFDNDLRRFWRHVPAALEKLYPGMFVQTYDVLLGIESGARLRQKSYIEGILTTLINALADVEDEIVLVLDDYDEIRNAFIHRSLAFLLDHLPENVHLFILTQHDPPLPLERWRTEHQLIEIHGDTLSFSFEEADHFLNTSMDLHLTTDEVTILHTYSWGSVALLQLAGLALQGQSDSGSFIEPFVRGFPPPSRDDLVAMILDKQPAEIQQFLMQTSLLDSMNPSLCDEVTRKSNSQLILASLEQSNPFVVALNDEHTWYQYHQCFSDPLRRSMDPKKVAILHRRAARWFESRGYYYDARRHFLQG